MPASILRRSALLLAAFVALAASGCQRTLFAYANRGMAPPDAQAVFVSAPQLRLDVYRPAASDVSPAPVVVFFHGGSWRTGRPEDYRFVGRRLADAGALVVVADYRKAPLPTFPGFMADAASAVRWARDHARSYGGDPARVYVLGHSAGAQIAGLLATDGRYLKAEGLAPRDLAGAIGLAGPYDFVIDRSLAPVFGDPALWPRAQALAFVDGDEPPFLLMHGREDRVVETRDSVDLAERVRATGGEATLVLIDGGHIAPLAGVLDRRRAPEVMPAILRFLRLPDASGGD